MSTVAPRRQTMPAVGAVAGRAASAVRGWPWWILVVALAIRLGLLLTSKGYVPFGDPVDYDGLARTIKATGEYWPSNYAAFGSPSGLRPPAYPYFLAGVYSVAGDSFTAARIAGAVLGAWTVLLVWSITRRLWDVRRARWAAAIAAIAPPMAWLSCGLVAETLFVPLVLAAVLALVAHRQQPAWHRILLAGALLGVAVMARTNGGLVVVPLMIGAWGARRQWRDPAVVLVGLLLALVPWTVRNATVFDTFAPLGTQDGYTLAGAWNAAPLAPGPFHGTWQLPAQDPNYAPFIRNPKVNEAQANSELRSRALDFAKEHPQYVAAITARHTLQLFEIGFTNQASPNSYREQGVPMGVAQTTGRVGILVLEVLALAAIAIAVMRRTWRRDLVWFWLVPVALFVSVVPLLGPPRYRVPVDPFLCIAAAPVLMGLWARRDWRWRRSASS